MALIVLYLYMGIKKKPTTFVSVLVLILGILVCDLSAFKFLPEKVHAEARGLYPLSFAGPTRPKLC